MYTCIYIYASIVDAPGLARARAERARHPQGRLPASALFAAYFVCLSIFCVCLFCFVLFVCLSFMSCCYGCIMFLLCVCLCFFLNNNLCASRTCQAPPGAPPSLRGNRQETIPFYSSSKPRKSASGSKPRNRQETTTRGASQPPRCFISICACHPCAGAMLIFSTVLQIFSPHANILSFKHNNLNKNRTCIGFEIKMKQEFITINSFYCPQGRLCLPASACLCSFFRSRLLGSYIYVYIYIYM